MKTATKRTWTLFGGLEAYSGMLWEPSDVVEIRPLPVDKGERRWILAAGLSGLAQELLQENLAGAGLHAGVLPRLAEGVGADADVVSGRVIWVDFDGVDASLAWTRVEQVGLPPPSMVIGSGHGTHCYWRLTDAIEPIELCGVVKDFAVLLGADTSAVNPSRMMRLPGFTNWKEPPAPCELLSCEPERRYDFADLVERVGMLAESKPQPPAPKPVATVPCNGGPPPLQRAVAYMAAVDGVAEGKRNAEAFRVAALLRNDFALSEPDAWPILIAWNARNSPPLPEQELHTVFVSAAKHAKRPLGNKADTQRRRAQAHDTMPPHRLPIPLPEPPDDVLAEMHDAMNAPRRTLHLPWHFLDEDCDALRPGSVCILAGPPGAGKSYLALSIMACVHDARETWCWLPLEDSRLDLQWRVLAVLANEYGVTREDDKSKNLRARLLEQYAQRLIGFAANLMENPRCGKKGLDGKTIIPPLPYKRVLDWLGRALETRRVVVIDPVSMLEFPTRDAWQGEADFMRNALGLAADTDGTVLLVTHTVKRPGKGAMLPVTLEDVQGTALIGRLAQTVLVLEAHDERDCDVRRRGGSHLPVVHNRTLLIGKSRNGSGTGQRYAFMQAKEGPNFMDFGPIAPRETRRAVAKESKKDYGTDF